MVVGWWGYRQELLCSTQESDCGSCRQDCHAVFCLEGEGLWSKRTDQGGSILTYLALLLVWNKSKEEKLAAD